MSVKSQQRITVKVEYEKELKEADKCCTSTAHHTQTNTHTQSYQSDAFNGPNRMCLVQLRTDEHKYSKIQ